MAQPSRGSWSTNSTERGFLYDAISTRQCSMTSSSVSVVTVADDDDRLHRLPPRLVGHADDRRLLHRGMFLERAFDLGGIDVLGRGLDQPPLRADPRQRSVLLAPAEVVGVVPVARQPLRVELVAVEVAVHDGGTAGHDLAHVTGRHLVAVGVDDAHQRHGRRTARRADGVASPRVEGEHPHDLGLAEPRGLAGPRAVVDGDHRVPLGRAAERAERRQVVAAVGVDLEHLLDGRAHHERAGAALGRR